MKKKKKGTPLDGQITYYDKNGNRVFPATSKYYPTMSLRDYFAGQALFGILYDMSLTDLLPPRDISPAEAAYEIADAMLKERLK